MLLFVASALAVQYQGTPVFTFRVDRPAGDYVEGAVGLEKLRVHHCGGGYTDVSVGATVDPVAPVSIPVPAGDHCAVTLHWSTDLDVDGPTWTVRYAQASTTLVLEEEIAPKLLSPWTVVAGTMQGGGPWLLAAID